MGEKEIEEEKRMIINFYNYLNAKITVNLLLYDCDGDGSVGDGDGDELT